MCSVLRVAINSRRQIHAEAGRRIPPEIEDLRVDGPARGPSVVAQRLIPQPGGRPKSVGGVTVPLSDEIEDNDQNPPDEAPETPTDEPKPDPVQDPPAEPGRAPYVVAGGR